MCNSLNKLDFTVKKKKSRYKPNFLIHICIFKFLSRVRLFATMDCSPPGSSVHGISQARILELVAIFFSRGPSPPRDGSHVSCIAGAFFITEPPGKPVFNFMYYLSFLCLHKLPFLLLVFLNFTHFKMAVQLYEMLTLFFFSLSLSHTERKWTRRESFWTGQVLTLAGLSL